MSWCFYTYADLYHYVTVTVSVQSLNRISLYVPSCTT